MSTVALSGPERHFLDRLRPEDRDGFLVQMHQLSSMQHGVPLRFRILTSHLPFGVKRDAFVRSTADFSPKYQTWLETALSMPLGKFCGPVARTQRARQRTLASAKSAMDAAVVGHAQAKDGVMRILTKMVSGKGTGVSIGLGGPPGIGKTTFSQNAMGVLGRPIVFLSMGGVFDSALLTGHSYTYEGATTGRIAEALREANCMNPILYFDELDKISDTPRGAEITNTLVHLTDRAQNSKFRDRYLGFDVDLSHVTFVFSYNDSSRVCPVLLDRINRIECEPPGVEDKLRIARMHLIPRSVAEHGLVNPPSISDETLRHIIDRHTSGELGVRNLGRCLDRIFGCYGVWKISPDILVGEYHFKQDGMTTEMVDRVLGISAASSAPSYGFMYA